MPRSYKRTTEKAKWTDVNLREALLFIENGGKIRGAARRFGIPYGSLQTRIKKGEAAVNGPKMGRPSVLSSEQEESIADHLKLLAKMFYGLTPQLRKLVFEYAEENGIKNSFNKRTQMAGKDWMYDFKRRNPTISAKEKKVKSKKTIKQPKLGTKVVKKKVKDSSSSDDFSEEWIPSGESEDDIDWAKIDVEDFSTEPTTVTDLNNKYYQEGDYILANFPSSKGKRCFRYVCIVTQVEGQLLEVNALNAIDSEHTTFKVNDNDVSEIHSSSVKYKLPNPKAVTVGSRRKYVFENPIDILEK